MPRILPQKGWSLVKGAYDIRGPCAMSSRCRSGPVVIDDSLTLGQQPIVGNHLRDVNLWGLSPFLVARDYRGTKREHKWGKGPSRVRYKGLAQFLRI